MSEERDWAAELEKINAEEAEELKALEIPFGHKRCTKCKEIRPHKEFAASSRAPDGLQAWCRECMSDYYQERKAREHQSVLSQLLSFPVSTSERLILDGRYTPTELRKVVVECIHILGEMGFGGDAGSTRGD
jgi:CRISPR/Cas system CSM-associated protein Csm4 (group 5 of RAMP superfamily)